MAKKNNWMHFRHKVARLISAMLLYPITMAQFRLKYDKFKDKSKQNYLIISNHVTSFDQFFVGYSFFHQKPYFVTTEDMFTKKFISPLLKYFLAPIPIKKSMTDTRAVMNCMKVAKEGGSIVLFPEGNRTFSGKTENMKAAIGKFVKALHLPIAFYNIIGGYGVQPRWSDVKRSGRVYGKITKVLTYDEYKDYSNEELFELIKENLYHDDFTINERYHHKKSAEYLDRLTYVCPHCGLSVFNSKNDLLTCTKCGLTLRYNDYMGLEVVKGECDFKNAKEWYEYQENFVRKMNLDDYQGIIYEDTVKFSLVRKLKSKEVLIKPARFMMYNDRYVFEDNKNNDKKYEFLFDDITATSVLGKNKINIYHNDEIYQVKAGKHFNAVKYVNIFYHYKNVKEGDTNEQFLGL